MCHQDEKKMCYYVCMNFTFGFFALALAAKNILFIDFGLTVGFLTFYERANNIVKIT